MSSGRERAVRGHQHHGSGLGMAGGFRLYLQLVAVWTRLCGLGGLVLGAAARALGARKRSRRGRDGKKRSWRRSLCQQRPLRLGLWLQKGLWPRESSGAACPTLHRRTRP
eukprot:gnl/Hemi2/14638_TR4972_c0_g2_i1.p3 gnl/Hemi2/14638_TR4972_c0_g2~~gnl/Hemi2/14638_TR4972_c0_g2_i1.p3  ORF type:complete len:110 (+),score=10.73 gnl/Hemi2/14638_TR4972_c0_g2_i1:59-388(+)